MRSGFIIAGNSDTEKVVNTNASWKAVQDFSWSPITGFSQMLSAYYVVGPGEKIDGLKHIWGWEQPDFDDSGWKNANPIGAGQPREFGTNGDWMLVPRNIPLMEESELRLSEVRSAEGVTIPDGFLTGKSRVDVGANKTVKILFDQGYLTKAYPVLKLNGGRNAEIKISYAESMFYADGSKGNRNEIEGKVFKGNYDIFLPDGEDNRTFRLLWFRTYRFVQMEIRTKDDPLTLGEFYGIFTAYPLEEKAVFDAGDETLKKIWDTGWRTARLCAAEIYYDCPYYEQMQYVGDTRIQSLISLNVSGDDRLMRNSIELFDVSRIPDGLTQSRYPASAMQIIPPFSLFWTLMVHDYWMNRNDPDYVRNFLPGIESVMGWFERRVTEIGMLGPLEWWNFADWTDEWKYNPERGYGGVPDGVSEGGSSIITLQFAYALRKAAELENFFGNLETARGGTRALPAG
ncbi:MAG TPA: hypothetical protein VI583_17560 [Cyclobacteriaceae bacterium]|nr:hypothetical protein [Cyclobacteriaceae bacterium]